MSPGEVRCWAEATAQPQMADPKPTQEAPRSPTHHADCWLLPAPCRPCSSGCCVGAGYLGCQLGLACFPTPCPNPTEF